jgi:hypothetical protein
MVGKVSKLTDRTKKKLLAAIRSGARYEQACRFAGIDYSTFRRWILKGEESENGMHREFCDEVKEAIAASEITCLSAIQDAQRRDWRAAAWLLENRFPARWGTSAKVQAATEGAIAQFLKDLEWYMSKDAYANLLETTQKIRATNLAPSKMTELEAVKVLLDASWLPNDIVDRLGEAYAEFQDAVSISFLPGGSDRVRENGKTNLLN